jgi:hypothetical protein
MVSYRKRHTAHIEDREAPPIAPTPGGGHAEPYPTPVDATPAPADIAKPEAETPKPAEQETPKLADSSPAEEAAKTAIRQRLAEMERAQELQREATPQYAESQPGEPPTVEKIIANSGLPERAKTWLREHSDYISDPSKNATLISLHGVAARQAGSEWTDDYFSRMDELLGFRPQPRQQQANGTQRVRQQQQTPTVGYSAPGTS